MTSRREASIPSLRTRMTYTPAAKSRVSSSITLSPAEILGVADRVGSLEAGKDATLFVADGDILETATQVEAAFVQGRRVDLDNRHKRLYRKYRERLQRARSDK